MTNQSWQRAAGFSMATVLLVLALILVPFSPAAAHISNESTQFPDIVASPHAGDVMMLVALDVIPQTPVFEPDVALTLNELAVWAALSHRLGEGGENPTVNDLAQAALEQGLVPSLEGEATYADINAALFESRLQLQEAEATDTPNKDEAAAFIASHLETDLSGETLLSRLGAILGPVGTVTKVETEGEGHHAAFTLTIGGTSFPVDAHGRVAFGPTDLAQWEGRDVSRSIVTTHDNRQVLSFVQSAEPFSGDASQQVHAHAHGHSGHEHGASAGHSHDEPIEIPVEVGLAVPTVELTVEPDAMSGWNIHVETTHFLWTPENVNGPVYMNEGHAHLYVDGEKVTRLYGPWYPLTMDLSPGTHTITVNLNANNHAPFTHNGEEIADTVTITVEE